MKKRKNKENKKEQAFFVEKEQETNEAIETWDEVFNKWQEAYFAKEDGKYKKLDFIEYLKKNYNSPTRKHPTK